MYGAELNQVWTNLIDNALQAMDGHGTLTIRTRRRDDSIEVEIADTGPGIPRRRSSPGSIEPFFTTKPVGQGTGLGLDISWRIVVNKHHGDLSVRLGAGRHAVRGAPAAARGGGGRAMSDISGIDPTVPPSGTGCVECDAAGGWWVHLRRCAQCGHVGLL